MKRLIHARVVPHFYGLPLFLFPITTAGSGIALGLLLLVYGLSNEWQNWREIGLRRWAWPWALFILWTLIGLAWTTNMFFGQKVAVATGYGLLAFLGATLSWNQATIKIVIRYFLFGILLNELIAIMMTLQLLPWPNGDGPMTGLCDHIFLSFILAHALFWLSYDWKHQWCFPRWITTLLFLLFILQLFIAPARSGQLTFVLFFPIALAILYPGRWRWGLPVLGLVLILVVAFTPELRVHFSQGITELLHFNLGKNDISSSWGLRLLAMWAGLLMFFNHPLVGVGTGNFYPAALQLMHAHIIPGDGGFIMNTAANSFLSVAASQGSIGLILFLLVIWFVGREAWFARNTPWGWFALSYFIIYLVGGLFDSLNWGYADAITVALMAGLPLHRRERAEL